MNNKDVVSEFVREALVSGRSRDDIAQALGQAGWTASEVSEGLNAFAPGDFVPPVPRPRSTVSARDFFIYALMLGSLSFGAGFLITLLHGLIDAIFGGDTSTWHRNSMRYAIAVLIVAVPLYGWLTWRESRRVAADPAMLRSAIRKWMIYLTLLATASVICISLVTTIYEFLKGELTVQFILKGATVFIIASLIFVIYRRQAARVSA